MPKKTFHNLPEDKRERIINASIDEFAEHFYHRASITRIVNKANIAKGSFYQYFKDKKDLFKYIIEVSTEKKIKYLSNVMKNMENLDFFELVRELYVEGIRFAQDHPKLQEIGNNLVMGHDDDLKKEILGDSIPKSNEMFEILLKKGIEKGDIDKTIDTKLVAHMITTLSISISEYFQRELKGDDNMELMKLVDNMLYIFKNGIKNKEEVNEND